MLYKWLCGELIFIHFPGNPIEETAEIGEIQTRPDEVDYEPVSSTLWRQREEYCAMVIQNAYKKYRYDDEADSAKTANENEVAELAVGADDTTVLVENDGLETINGHDVIIRSRSSSKASASEPAEVCK